MTTGRQGQIGGQLQVLIERLSSSQRYAGYYTAVCFIWLLSKRMRMCKLKVVHIIYVLLLCIIMRRGGSINEAKIGKPSPLISPSEISYLLFFICIKNSNRNS